MGASNRVLSGLHRVCRWGCRADPTMPSHVDVDEKSELQEEQGIEGSRWTVTLVTSEGRIFIFRCIM